MKNNFFLLLVFVGVSLLFGLPHLLIPKLLGGASYDPLGGGNGPQSAIVTEEVYTYVSEVQEILEGKFPIRDTQLVDYKNTQSPFSGETLPAILMALLSKLSGSVEKSFMVADFLFPPISMFLVYLLCRKLTVSKKLSIVAAVVSIVAADVIALVPYPKPLWDFLVNLKGRDDFLFFSRNFHPQLSFLLFIGMVLVIIEAMKVGGWKRNAGAGILIGAQFYTYFFSWTATVAMLAILTVWQVWKRNWKLVKRITVASLMGLIIALPYVWEMHQFRISPLYQNFFSKNSLPARSFVSISARYAVLLSVAYWLTKKKRTPALTILMATVAATIVLPELASLFLGRDPEGKHWIRRLLVPLAFPLAAVVCGDVYRRQTWFKLKRRASSALVLIGLGMIFLFGVRVQISASEKFAGWFHRQEDKQSLFDWFNLNGKAGETVATLNSGLIAEIPAFTKLDNVVPITTRSVATTQETLSRFLEVARLYQLPPEDVGYLLWTGEISADDPARARELAEMLLDSKGSWVSRIFYFTANDEGKIFFLSRKRRESVIEEYRERIETKYRIDYILVGPVEKKMLEGDTLVDRFPIAYKNGSYSVYRVKN